MELTKDSPVIKNLFLKRDLLRAGDKDHEKIRTALIILGGGMSGVDGAGSAHALHLLDMTYVFDVDVCTSIGSGIGAYFLCGLKRGLRGLSIYYQDLPPKFIKYTRNPVVDIELFEWIIRDSPKKLDVDTIRMSRSEFFIGTTDFETGEHLLINVKKAEPDIISALKASMAIIGLYNKPVMVNGRHCIDSGGYPFPIREVVDRFSPTDILVIPNCSKNSGRDRSQMLIEKFCGALITRNSTPKLRNIFKNRHQRWLEDLDYFENLKDINKGILWTQGNSVKPLTRNPKKLRAAAMASAKRTLEIFGHPEIEVNLL